MIEDKSNLVPFLNRLALFRKLTPVQLEKLVENFELVELSAGEQLFSQGEPGDSMYIVVSGKVRISRGPENRERELATFVKGDIFGEESLVYNRPRSATVTAVETTQLLRLDKAHLSSVIREFPYIKPYLIAIVNSRRLARQHPYEWLAPGETIYLMARKHSAALVLSLGLPFVIGLVGIFSFIFAAMSWEIPLLGRLLLAIGAGLSILALGLGLWIWIDWGNDYYIVTNQRVIWLEKVIGLYESRVEAPLSTVLSIGTKMDATGRALEYGNVIVRTFTGQIVMHRVGHPEQLASLILELQDRARSQIKDAQTAALEREIRKRLNLPEPAGKEAPPKESAPQPPKRPQVKRSNPLSLWLRGIFMVRFEQKGVVTYRKHPILLLEGIWKPSLVMLAGIVVIVLSLSNVIPIIPPIFVVSLLVVAEFFLFLWWVYEYVDWRNDIYQLTADQIIDIYRKPLGSEDKKSANLENILSLQNERKGFIGLLLNYGNVTAMVGGTKFTFEGVFNPAAVEQDIFERINARKQQQREAEDARERERVAEWMAAYHRQMEALRRGENKPNFDGNSG